MKIDYDHNIALKRDLSHGLLVVLVVVTCRKSRVASVMTKIVKHAKAVMSVVQTPNTAALVFSGTAFFIHATPHMDADKTACWVVANEQRALSQV